MYIYYIYVYIYINIYMYIYIYVFIYILYIYIIYLYLSLFLSIYIAIVCDHEIAHTSYAIYRDKIYIYKTLWPLFVDGCNYLKARQSHYKETIYF